MSGSAEPSSQTVEEPSVFFSPLRREYDDAGEDVTHYMIASPFVVYDERGFITGGGTQGLGHIEEAIARGERLLVGDARLGRTFDTDPTLYVDLSGASPALAKRPTWTPQPSTLTPRTYEEVHLPDCPPGVAVFTGPMSGEQEHVETGDMLIGWTIPGTYNVTFKIFPYMDTSLTIEVSGEAAQ